MIGRHNWKLDLAVEAFKIQESQTGAVIQNAIKINKMLPFILLFILSINTFKTIIVFNMVHKDSPQVGGNHHHNHILIN